jgi:hypothetical protein
VGSHRLCLRAEPVDISDGQRDDLGDAQTGGVDGVKAVRILLLGSVRKSSITCSRLRTAGSVSSVRVSGETCTVLVHAHDRRVDHLDGGIMGGSERVNDPAPQSDTEPIVRSDT